MENGPKILVIDIETAPILAWVWGLFDQNIGLEQVEQDWTIISFAAKWAGEEEVFQYDLRKGITPRNEKSLLLKAHTLLDEADIVVGQNSKKFDVKKLNEKFLQHGIKPPSPYRQLDTLQLSKKYFSPTSHKLEYRSKNLNKKYKKLSHSKFPGFSLWKECLKGNQDAWEEMGIYNIFDVKSTEEYFDIIKVWDNSINYDTYHDAFHNVCKCGASNWVRRGYNHTNAGKFQRYKCRACGTWTQSKKNMLIKEKRDTFRK